MFDYELSGCRIESHCSHSNFRYCAYFDRQYLTVLNNNKKKPDIDNNRQVFSHWEYLAENKPVFTFRKYQADHQVVDGKDMITVENQSFELDHITLTNDESKYKIVFIKKLSLTFCCYYSTYIGNLISRP